MLNVISDINLTAKKPSAESPQKRTAPEPSLVARTEVFVRVLRVSSNFYSSC